MSHVKVMRSTCYLPLSPLLGQLICTVTYTHLTKSTLMYVLTQRRCGFACRMATELTRCISIKKDRVNLIARFVVLESRARTPHMQYSKLSMNSHSAEALKVSNEHNTVSSTEYRVDRPNWSTYILTVLFSFSEHVTYCTYVLQKRLVS